MLLLKKMDNKHTKRVHKKRRSWVNGKERLLIEVWKQYFPALQKAKRNIHVIKKMSAQLSKMGVVAAPNEVRIKIKNLTQKYRNEKKTHDTFCGTPSEWEFYHEVDAFLGSFKCYDFPLAQQSIKLEPEYVIPDTSCSSSYMFDDVLVPKRDSRPTSPTLLETPSSSGSSSRPISTTPSETPCSSGSSFCPISPTTSPRKKERLHEKLLKEIQLGNKLYEEEIKLTKEATEKLQEIEKQKLEMINKHMEKSLEIQSQLLLEISRRQNNGNND